MKKSLLGIAALTWLFLIAGCQTPFSSPASSKGASSSSASSSQESSSSKDTSSQTGTSSSEESSSTLSIISSSLSSSDPALAACEAFFPGHIYEASNNGTYAYTTSGTSATISGYVTKATVAAQILVIPSKIKNIL
jgi:cytoskeletal protein RodZ